MTPTKPQFVRFSTSNGETRWINVAAVARIILTHEPNTDERLLVIVFGPTDHVTVHGTDAVNNEAIDTILQLVEQMTVGEFSRSA